MAALGSHEMVRAWEEQFRTVVDILPDALADALLQAEEASNKASAVMSVAKMALSKASKPVEIPPEMLNSLFARIAMLERKVRALEESPQ